MTANRVPAGVLAAYAGPAFALAAVGIPLYIHLPKFYSDVVGVPISVVGGILLAARLFDAVSDPVIGRISDATRSRWGRRRPYIALGAIWVAVFLFALLHPPDLNAGAATTWLAVTLFMTFLGWTAVTIPYESLAPEITENYDERTRLVGYRDGALVLGFVFAAALPVLIGGGEDPAAARQRFSLMAWILSPLMLIAAVYCVLRIRERKPREREPGTTPASFKSALNNQPFRVLFIAYAVNAIGSNLPATLLLYYVKYVLESNRADMFLLIYLLTGVIALPFWVALSHRTSKKFAWLISMAINTGAFAGVFFLGAGDELLYGVLTFISGTGSAATIALPSAMQADVVDLDALENGERREGLYMGLWAIARKLSAALGVGVALPILGAVGYEPNQAQSESVLLALRLLYAGIPIVCSIASMLILLRYQLDREDHARIVAELSNRQNPRAAPTG